MKKTILLLSLFLLGGSAFALTPADGDAWFSRPLPLDYYTNPVSYCQWNYPDGIGYGPDGDNYVIDCSQHHGFDGGSECNGVDCYPSRHVQVGVPYPFGGNTQYQSQYSNDEINDATGAYAEFDPYEFDHSPELGNNPTSTEDNEIVTWLHNNGLTVFSDPVAFGPGKTLTREQSAKFYAAFAVNVMHKTEDMSKNCTFSDIGQSDPTLTSYIISACRLGILKGYQGKISPKEELSTDQAETMFIRIIVGMLPENGPQYYTNYHNKGAELGYFNTYFVRTSAKRGVTAGYFYRYANPTRDHPMNNTSGVLEL